MEWRAPKVYGPDGQSVGVVTETRYEPDLHGLEAEMLIIDPEMRKTLGDRISAFVPLPIEGVPSPKPEVRARRRRWWRA